MSIRALGSKLFKHGRVIIRHICQNQREYNSSTISETINVVQQAVAPRGPQASNVGQIVPRTFALRNVGIQVGLHARRILIDNVLNRVTNSLASELRKKAAKRILFGDSGPFFALVGVSLASGTGILTKEEELEGVCWEIREAISKIKWNINEPEIDEVKFENNPITLNDLSLGKAIDKGANAVVYAAKIKELENVDDVHINQQKVEDTSESEQKNVVIQKNININGEDNSLEKYPLALKMMFNYDIQSSAMAILRGMYRETVPARIYYSNVGVQDWELDLSKRKRHLPPHPNIVAMYSVFTDFIPELSGAVGLYPMALPQRIHPDGAGRNMSLFLLMKRYNCSLQQFISSSEPNTRTSILLLSQLLEGIAHLTAHGIAHRDLKSDNVLIDTSESNVPILVITDFGCCLADRANGLHLPFTSDEIDRGGNTALMAPEIYLQTPGTFSVLNYTKSDLWSAGAIAYEIFRMNNPFYQEANSKKLKNSSYKEEELPDLPEDVPQIFNVLVKNLLMRNPNKRLDPEVAANICQLYLWAPSAWLKPMIKLPSSAEILQWLLTLTTKVLCEGRALNCPVNPRNNCFNHLYVSNLNSTERNYSTGRRTYPEYLLISSFLCRVKLANIRAALNWIQNNL